MTNKIQQELDIGEPEEQRRKGKRQLILNKREKLQKQNGQFNIHFQLSLNKNSLQYIPSQNTNKQGEFTIMQYI